MNELRANLWEVEADLRLITTNGAQRKDGAAVMGRGCAREAKERIPGLEHRLGALLAEHGNRVMRLCRYRGTDLASFPVKHLWWQKADPDLIRRSLEQLVALADKLGYTNVVLPRPGAGNGGLDYFAEVRPLLQEALDERFTILSC